MRQKSWILLLRVAWIIVVATIVGTAVIPRVYRATSSDTLISYWGAILGGIFSGVFTLTGVLLTLLWSQKQDDKRLQERMAEQVVLTKEENGKRANRIRLIVLELKQNQRLIQTALTSLNWQLIETLRFSIWGKLNVELDWLENDLFKELYEMYGKLEQLVTYVDENSRLPDGASTLANNVNSWSGYTPNINSLCSRLEGEITRLEEPH